MAKSEKNKIIVVIVAISFIQGLQFCVSPVLGQIQDHFAGVNVSLVQMLVTAPTLLSMAVALASGGLVVKISKKKLLVFAGLVAGVTGFLPLLADSFLLLFVSRTIYGLGLGLACTLNTAVVAEFFEGDERVSVMGIQSASIGAGMVVVSTVGGKLGTYGFEKTYFLNIIGFISMLVIAFCLPDTGKVKVTSTEKIRMTPKVFELSALGVVEFLFLITFTTNIAMHLGGKLTGSTEVSGMLTGVFSAAQIIMGLALGFVKKFTGKYTISAAMICFVLGGIILILFPDNYPLLIIAALFCGFSQGMFVPQVMVDASNAVSPVATAMAAACITCSFCLGQFISPTILNSVSGLLFGAVSTTNVYKIATVGMALAAICAFLLSRRQGVTQNAE